MGDSLHHVYYGPRRHFMLLPSFSSIFAISSTVRFQRLYRNRCNLHTLLSREGCCLLLMVCLKLRDETVNVDLLVGTYADESRVVQSDGKRRESEFGKEGGRVRIGLDACFLACEVFFLNL
jgi:hypothetical protein